MKNLDFDLIDIHSHIVPKVDDGSKSIEMSLNMADIAYEEGIRTIVCTPHYHPVKCRNNREELLPFYDEFVKKALIKHPDMEYYLGREVFYISDIIDDLSNGMNLSMVGGKAVLLEYDYGCDYKYIYRSVSDVYREGYTPIIAHVERYVCMLNNWDRIEELKNEGALIQVNADSVTGKNGNTVKKYVKKLLKCELIDFIGTDAHRDNLRTPMMKECAELLIKKYGHDYAKKILCDNARAVIEGRI